MSGDQLLGLSAIIGVILSGAASIISSVRNGNKIDQGTTAAKDTAQVAANAATEAKAAVADVKSTVEAVHAEVASPNGATTGEAVADLHAIVLDLTSKQAAQLAAHETDPFAHRATIN